MSAIGLDTGHISEHFTDDGLCQCPCADCTTRMSKECVCMMCPCDPWDGPLHPPMIR